MTTSATFSISALGVIPPSRTPTVREIPAFLPMVMSASVSPTKMVSPGGRRDVKLLADGENHLGVRFRVSDLFSAQNRIKEV
jgi:hypothetical protein